MNSVIFDPRFYRTVCGTGWACTIFGQLQSRYVPAECWTGSHPKCRNMKNGRKRCGAPVWYLASTGTLSKIPDAQGVLVVCQTNRLFFWEIFGINICVEQHRRTHEQIWLSLYWELDWKGYLYIFTSGTLWDSKRFHEDSQRPLHISLLASCYPGCRRGPTYCDKDLQPGDLVSAVPLDDDKKFVPFLLL